MSHVSEPSCCAKLRGDGQRFCTRCIFVPVASAHQSRSTRTPRLTKLDGDARGGAALSLKSVTGRPIKFVGIGEKLDEFESFHPERMAGRILGMGDVVSLVEKAAEVIEEAEAAAMEEKLRNGQFTLEDFLEQMRAMKKLGPLENIVGMLPGGDAALKDADLDKGQAELRRMEALICAMTPKERRQPNILGGGGMGGLGGLMGR